MAQRVNHRGRPVQCHHRQQQALDRAHRQRVAQLGQAARALQPQLRTAQAAREPGSW